MLIPCSPTLFKVTKTLGKEKSKGTLANDALKQIVAIYKIEGMLNNLTPEERKQQRQLMVQPLVDAFFAWIKEHQSDVLPKSEAGWMTKIWTF